MRHYRVSSICVLAIIVGNGIAAFSQDNTVVLSFDDLADKASVTTNYKTLGVTFLQGTPFPGISLLSFPVVRQVPHGGPIYRTIRKNGSVVPIKIGDLPAQAHSGNQVADISQCTGGMPCEFAAQAIGGQLDKPATRVQVYVGAFQDNAGTAEVNLKGFDASHHLLNSSSVTVTAGAGFQTPLVVISTQPIAYFELSAPASSAVRVGMDDLTIETIATPSQPDFDVTGPQAIELRQGSSSDVTLTVRRFNGSVGAVTFGVDGLPSGVSAAFKPRVTRAASPPEEVILTLSAAPAASTNAGSPTSITIKASPTELRADVLGDVRLVSSGAGPANKQIVLGISVVPNFYVQLLSQPAITVPECSPVEIPLRVVRAPGFRDPVLLGISNVPPGISASFSPNPAVFSTDGALATNVSLNLVPHPGSVQNVMSATIAGSSPPLAIVTTPLMITTTFTRCELTPSASGNGRGCGLFNLSPEWVSAGNTDVPRVAQGLVVVESKRSGEDNWAKHYSYDWNFRLELQEPFAQLNSDANQQHNVPDMTDVDGTVVPSHRALTLEVEWETDYFPELFRPQIGDRAFVVGRWIFDCGHPPFETEIHPPHFVAFARRSSYVFQGESAPADAMLVYLYAYGRGSGLRGVVDYFSIEDSNMSAFANDYEFELPTPTRPTNASQLKTEVVSLPFGGPTPIFTLVPGANAIHVKYPLALPIQSNRNSKFGAVVAVSWK